MIEDFKINITKRHLPHWTLKDSVYFITFCLLKGELSETERKIVLEHIKKGNGRFMYYILHDYA
jgi:hypothetical protein